MSVFESVAQTHFKLRYFELLKNIERINRHRFVCQAQRQVWISSFNNTKVLQKQLFLSLSALWVYLFTVFFLFIPFFFFVIFFFFSNRVYSSRVDQTYWFSRSILWWGQSWLCPPKSTPNVGTRIIPAYQPSTRVKRRATIAAVATRQDRGKACALYLYFLSSNGTWTTTLSRLSDFF